MNPPNDKDRAALIVGLGCFVGLLIEPSLTLPCGIVGIIVLLLALARQM
jgi:putative effector of murein hydrolase LrgA (UPF0299 family)